MNRFPKFLLFLITLFCGTHSFAQSEQGTHTTNRIEFSTLTDASRSNRSVPIKVHLPSGEGPFPVVIVSHGAGGNLDANFAQANHLATHGYIAVCVEHVGSNSTKALAGGLRVGKTIADMTRDAGEVMDRPKDIHFAIDQMEVWNRTHATLKGKCDLQRIGVMGHSFGAYTTLVVCGARPALDWFRPRIGDGKGLGPDFSDKRIRCGVALSPQGPGEPFFLKTSYKSIGVPLLGISGSRDKQQNADPIHRKNSFQYWPKGDRYFLWINNATHLQFSDSTGSKPRRNNALSGIGERREDVQKVSRAATLVFLDQYLKKSPDAKLREADLEKYMGGIVDGIELLSK
ncbi:MAG: hypothetical protein WBD20_16695 [Pirellulaceae bacterium]